MVSRVAVDRGPRKPAEDKDEGVSFFQSTTSRARSMSAAVKRKESKGRQNDPAAQKGAPLTITLTKPAGFQAAASSQSRSKPSGKRPVSQVPDSTTQSLQSAPRASQASVGRTSSPATGAVGGNFATVESRPGPKKRKTGADFGREFEAQARKESLRNR